MYRNNYNTRNAPNTRYSSSGQYAQSKQSSGGNISSSEPLMSTQQGYIPTKLEPNQYNQQPYKTLDQSFQSQEQYEPSVPHTPPPPLPLDNQDEVMDDGGKKKRPWMRTEGVVKITNRERRRRQNERLRKLLTPKNALMVLNELVPGDKQLFNVEPAPLDPGCYNVGKLPPTQFCAAITIDGVPYKGVGVNKVVARNSAAEQAIRDLVIKQMTQVVSTQFNPSDLTKELDGSDANGEDTPAAFPMIQLASYALHKLFVEWQAEGYQVPLLNRQPAADTSSVAGDTDDSMGKPKPAKKAKEPKQLPADAANIHPSMLLSQMRPGLDYHEISVEGDKPQNLLFTVGVTVDGATYIGKASSKKQARKLAARSACQAIFNVTYQDEMMIVA